MPCYLVIKNSQGTNSNLTAEETLQKLHRIGDIVEIFDADKIDEAKPNYGLGLSASVPENFVMVKITDAAKADLIAYNGKPWKIDLDWEVVNSDTSIDGWRLRIYNTIPGNAVSGNITKEQVENFLYAWGVDPDTGIVSFSTNSVTFDVLIWDAIKSRKFWRGWVPCDNEGNYPTLNETYNEGTATHSVTLDYNAKEYRIQAGHFIYVRESVNETEPETNENVKNIEFEDPLPNILKRALLILEESGAIITNNNETGKILEFNITRQNVLNRFKRELKENFEDIIRRKRHYITSSVISQLENYINTNNAIQEVSLATVLTYIQDKLND